MNVNQTILAEDGDRVVLAEDGDRVVEHATINRRSTTSKAFGAVRTLWLPHAAASSHHLSIGGWCGWRGGSG